jgi:tRNA (guanine-N7-)-methyltransferase
MYHRLLAPGGKVKLKTDSDELWAYVGEVLDATPGLVVLAETNNLYASPLQNPENSILTHFERKWLATTDRTIKYLELSFAPDAFVQSQAAPSETMPLPGHSG